MGAQLQPLIDEFINQTQKQLYTRAYWARLSRRLEFSLVTDQTDYDIPSVTTIGGIHRVTVADLNGREIELKYEDVLEVQDFTRVNSSRPIFFSVNDDVLRISPSPDATKFPTMFMEVELALTKLVADTDRTVIDTEALVQGATILLRKDLGTGGSQASADADLRQYLLDLRGLVSPNRSYPIASRTIDGPAYWRQPSVNQYAQPFSTDWNPW